VGFVDHQQGRRMGLQQRQRPGLGQAFGRDEPTTPVWFALKLSPSTFGVFDAFHDEAGRQAHLTGPIAQALMAKAPELFAGPPTIEPIEVLGLKNSGAA
jgi:hypothetical protein